MWRDPIVEQVRKVRQEYAARYNYDISAICRAARQRQKESGRKTVSRPAKPVTNGTTAARDAGGG
jgi:hypothetical protein